MKNCTGGGGTKTEDRYHHGCHSKYCLRVHLIFVCKYRRRVLAWDIFADALKAVLEQTAESVGCRIVAQETDRDHIHLLVH